LYTLATIASFIPNFGERYRNGETISTAFVESTINQVVSRRFVKKQSMQWTLRGAHLLLQTRTKVLNEELDTVFRRWYPKFRSQPKEIKPQPKSSSLTPGFLARSLLLFMKDSVRFSMCPRTIAS
jgi:hypothetical protein